ncbi:MAG TPA: hypothetical protein VLF62_05705, partial [Candidatus Saccharimonadales bacterium]|nr:hypothetical protein [Candidatus Saccharimonadales bacterium]
MNEQPQQPLPGAPTPQPMQPQQPLPAASPAPVTPWQPPLQPSAPSVSPTPVPPIPVAPAQTTLPPEVAAVLQANPPSMPPQPQTPLHPPVGVPAPNQTAPQLLNYNSRRAQKARMAHHFAHKEIHGLLLAGGWLVIASGLALVFGLESTIGWAVAGLGGPFLMLAAWSRALQILP